MDHSESLKSIRQRIYMFLDNELAREEEEKLVRSMEDDPRTSRLMDQEKQFRDFLKSNLKRPSVSPDFKKNLKSIIST
jgi:hypothetical protein